MIPQKRELGVFSHSKGLGAGRSSEIRTAQGSQARFPGRGSQARLQATGSQEQVPIQGSQEQVHK